MNRRGFLGVLSAAFAGAVLDPERLLWVPRQKTIFVMPPIVQPRGVNPNLGQMVAEEWMRIIGSAPLDNIFETRAMFSSLLDDARS